MFDSFLHMCVFLCHLCCLHIYRNAGTPYKSLTVYSKCMYYSIYSLSSFFDKCRNKTLTRIFVTEIFQRKNKFLGNFEIGFIGCRTPLLSCPDKMFIGIYKRDYTVTIYFWFFNLRNEWMVAGYIWSFSTAIEKIKHWHKVYIYFN